MALAASYRHMSNFTPTRPDHDTVTLYDVAISALGDAVEAIHRDEIEGRCGAVYQATDAVTTLYLRLDVKRFGEYTDELADLYGHVLGCLVGINFYNDPRIAQDAIELLHSLKEKCTAEIGMVPAYVPTGAPTHGSDAPRPAQNT